MRLRTICLLLSALLLAGSFSSEGNAQTTTSGGLSGVVTDPTHAVVPDANVEARDSTKGTTDSTKTNSYGEYQFPFLRHTKYVLSVTHSGFQEERRSVTVEVGPSVTVNITLPVAHIRRNLGDLNIPMPGGEYEYSALPLCVTDAVFSLGVRYESTERTVREVCERYGWEMSRKQAPEEERTISDFLRILQPYENRWEDMARDVFRNHQRTSSRSGILKSEAVYRVCKILRDHGAETFASFRRALESGQCDDLRRAFTAVRGQGSGLSFNYLRILTGDTNAVKADRKVTRFVADAMRVRDVKPELCERLVREASAILRTEYPKLTPSLLDHAIWKYQRAQEETSQTACSRLPESKLGSNLGPDADQLGPKPCTTT